MLVVAPLLVCFMSYASAQCPDGCACVRSNRRILCSAASFTEIPDFPEDIKRTAEELNLATNMIVSVNNTDLQGFANLEMLDLSANSISSIEEGSFSSNSALEILDLSDNRLSEIPDDLFESNLIFELDLSNNDIETLYAAAFTGIQDDATIRLDGNSIQTIEEDVFASIRVDQLTLSENPLRCDCELSWLPEFVASVRVIMGTCSTPESLNTTTLEELTVNDTVCDCTPACVNGTCDITVGECICDDGFSGNACDIGVEATTQGEPLTTAEERDPTDYTSDPTEAPSTDTASGLPVYGLALAIVFGCTLVIVAVVIVIVVVIVVLKKSKSVGVLKVEPTDTELQDGPSAPPHNAPPPYKSPPPYKPNGENT